LKIERMRSDDGTGFRKTNGVSKLLPEYKIIELYNIGNNTRKPITETHLHQPSFGAPVISITYAAPTFDSKGRETTMNHTFLISLRDITVELEKTLIPFFEDKGEVKPLELAKLSIIRDSSEG
jgi:hypothetical protein